MFQVSCETTVKSLKAEGKKWIEKMHHTLYQYDDERVYKSSQEQKAYIQGVPKKRIPFYFCTHTRWRLALTGCLVQRS